MASQLTIDCLNKIFEYLQEDKVSLHSCLLVNRFWCTISVEILWKNIWNFECTESTSHDSSVPLKLFDTLITCLPNESIVFLCENGVSIPTPTSKSPLFNYASFIKVLSISQLIILVNFSYKKIPTENSKRNYLVTQEILKMFMKQVYSLKKLDYRLTEGCYDEGDEDSSNHFKNISNFINFPGAKDCLNNLSEFRCTSDINHEFFRQLSQICHSIQSLELRFCCISEELEELIFSQKSLKSLSFIKYGDYYYYYDDEHDYGDDDDDDDEDDDSSDDDVDLFGLGRDGTHTITYNFDDNTYTYKFNNNSNDNNNDDNNDNNDDDNNDNDNDDNDDNDNDDDHHHHNHDQTWPKIASLLTTHSNTITNLLLEYKNADFKEIQYITFPHLKILKFVNCPEINMVIKFLENNGKYLKEFYVNKCDKSLNLAIAELCPNLKSLHTLFPKNELEILKIIFEGCQELESILAICGNAFLGGKKFLEIVFKYSPISLRVVKLHSHVKLGSKDLQSFFIGWKTRIPQYPVSLIITDGSFKIDIKTGEMIARYKKLGIIKKFEIDQEFFLNMYKF